MRTELRTEDGGAAYALMELDEAERAAAVELGFAIEGDEAIRRFPADDVTPFFERFERHGQAMLDQASRRVPTPWADALLSIAELAGDVDWWLTGSGALAVRGVGVVPRDLDLVTSSDGALALGAAFREHAVEPLSDASGWIAQFFGRAFLGMRVEWVGGVVPSVDSPDPVDFGPVAEASLETVEFCGIGIRVPPLELQLGVAERRGLTDRAAAIGAALGA